MVATGWEPKLGVLVVVGAEGMKLGSALVAEGAKLGSALVAVEVKLGGAPGSALVAEGVKLGSALVAVEVKLGGAPGSALVAEGVKLGSALVAVEVKLGGAPGGALVAEVANINGLGAEPAEDCPNLKAPESAVVGAFDVSADLNRFTFGGAVGFVGGTDESDMTQNQQNTKQYM